jgi:hypothetical protein
MLVTEPSEIVEVKVALTGLAPAIVSGYVPFGYPFPIDKIPIVEIEPLAIDDKNVAVIGEFNVGVSSKTTPLTPGVKKSVTGMEATEIDLVIAGSVDAPIYATIDAVIGAVYAVCIIKVAVVTGNVETVA